MAPATQLRLVTLINTCRYVVYFGVCVLLVADAWLTHTNLDLRLVYFFVAPSVIHGLQIGFPRHKKMLYACEGLMGLAILHTASTGILGAYGLVVLLSNLALWGFSWPTVACSMSVVGVVSVAVLSNTFHPFQSTIDQIAWLAAVIVVAVVIALTRYRALQNALKRSVAERERRELLKFLPAEIVHHLTRADPVKRSWLTVAFVDLSGFTRAVNAMAPEQVETVLNDFFATATEAVEASGGSVAKFLGDGLLCLFAAPKVCARGSTAAACVRGLATLVDGMETLNEKWRAQGCALRFGATVGIASGHCTVGYWGRGTRMDFTVVGAPVNLAHRLQQAADQHGGHLLDRVTAQLVAPLQIASREVDIDAKGFGPLTAFVPMGHCLLR